MPALIAFTGVIAFILPLHAFPLPPEPSGLPVIGNLLDMPSSHAAQTFMKWAEKWGDIISITLPGQTMVIVNTPQAAIELLDRKGAIYSDRSILPVAGRIMGYDQTLGLYRYGPAWREGRRIVSRTLGTRRSIDNLADQLEEEVHRLLVSLATSPDQLFEHVRRCPRQFFLSYNIAKRWDIGTRLPSSLGSHHYGYTVQKKDGEIVLMSVISVTRVPTWILGAGWKRRVLRWRIDYEEMRDVLFELAKQQMSEGSRLNLVANNLDLESSPEREITVRNAAASLYGGKAAFQVTHFTVYAFFLAMMCFPEAQSKAQEEIDRIVGNERLPTLSDIDDLPYVRALTWDVLRWQPVTPLGSPHRLIQDDIHDGYFLPEGAIVMASIWAMTRDPSRYHNPLSFNPGRFLPSDGTEPEYDPREIVFGFGRRSLEFTSSTISHPSPFVCSVTLRSSKAIELISVMREESSESRVKGL
ncbi:cytochrome P450 [Fomitopsis betulina]|nr:cytochrome P450 [Fomitopsis betulina]